MDFANQVVRNADVVPWIPSDGGLPPVNDVAPLAPVRVQHDEDRQTRIAPFRGRKGVGAVVRARARARPLSA